LQYELDGSTTREGQSLIRRVQIESNTAATSGELGHYCLFSPF
jgi:hypothetical protein